MEEQQKSSTTTNVYIHSVLLKHETSETLLVGDCVCVSVGGGSSPICCQGLLHWAMSWT